MKFSFRDKDLERLYTEDVLDGRFSEEIVKLFRRRMQMIANAPDERDFYALKSLHFERLRGKRKHQHSIRLNKQWRVVVEFAEGETEKTVIVVAIEDYH
jgi:toxin HigB-1